MVVKIIVQKSSTKKRKKKCIYNSRPEQFEDANTLLYKFIFLQEKETTRETFLSTLCPLIIMCTIHSS